MTLMQIGARLGISHQRVQQLLAHRVRVSKALGVRCRECGAQLLPKGATGGTLGAALCLGCLAEHPGAGFPQRLRALRLAGGLTLGDLAQRSGLTSATIMLYEHGKRNPKPRSLAQLVRVLGPGLVPTEGPGP
jgi:DNA-binding XRE family transcriptional regulator